MDVDGHIAAAEKRGFRVIEVHPRRESVRAGARARHSSHRWDSAYWQGTADVVAVMRRGSDERPDAWELKYGRPNIEIVARLHSGEIVEWADYHVEIVDVVKAP